MSSKQRVLGKVRICCFIGIHFDKSWCFMAIWWTVSSNNNNFVSKAHCLSYRAATCLECPSTRERINRQTVWDGNVRDVIFTFTLSSWVKSLRAIVSWKEFEILTQTPCFLVWCRVSVNEQREDQVLKHLERYWKTNQNNCHYDNCLYNSSTT